MTKVLLVDDESIFRFGIKSCIRWEENGLVLVGEADNGKVALEKITELQPDVVLLDLKMPVMDGMDVIVACKERYPQIELIVLSCANEYENVRKAMKLGAMDYLFKPLMEPDDILKILLEASEKTAYRKKHIKDNTQEIHNKRNFIKEMYHGELSPEKIADGVGKFHLPLKKDAYCGLLIYCEQKNYNTPMNQDRIQMVVSVVEENLICDQGFIVEIENNDIICLINIQNKNEYIEECSTICNRISKYVTHYLGNNLVFCISEVAEDYNHTTQVFHQCRQSLEDAFWKTSIRPFALMLADSQSADIDKEYPLVAKKIDDVIRSNEYEVAYNLLADELVIIMSVEHYDKNSICKFIVRRVINSIHTLSKKLRLESLLLEHFLSVASIYKSNTLNEAMGSFSHIMKQLEDNFGEITYSPVVVQSIHYIEKNYNRNINLEEISRFVHMNKNYFCKVFKEETGESFVSYHTKMRMSKAFELLQEDNSKACDIAEMLGYTNYQYFCKLYKKYIGLNPSQSKGVSFYTNPQ